MRFHYTIAKYIYREYAKYRIPESWRALILAWAEDFERTQAAALDPATANVKPEGPDRAALLEAHMKLHGRETIRYVGLAGGLTRAVNNVLYPHSREDERAALKPHSEHKARAIAAQITQISSVRGFDLDSWLEYGSKGTPQREFGYIRDDAR